MRKVIAIASITTPPSPEQFAEVMPREVPHTLQLYLDGKIDQFWHRKDKQGVVFLFNVETVEEAKAIVDAMPLVAGGFATYEYIPVGPLAPLGRLIQAK